MDGGSDGSQRSKLRIALLLIGIPVLVFYLLLGITAVNLPFFDDYESVLRFLNVFSQLHGFSARLYCIATFQHVEYKLMFESALFGAGYLILRYVNFVFFSALGNACVALIFAVLFLFWRRQRWSDEEIQRGDRVLWFAPVAFLLFQLQYASTLNWSMGGLQNLPVLVFSLLAIERLSGETKGSYIVACACLILAMASSGNGFLLVPVGVLIVMQRRRFWRLAPWLLVSALLAALYYHGYNFALSQDRPVIAGAHHISLAYALSFLGASLARFDSATPSILLGAAFCCVFGHAVWRRYHQRNAPVFYAMLFLIITAVAVSYLRSGEGIVQSLASRYRIYSNLGLIFVYMYLMECARPLAVRGKLSRRTVFASALGLAIVFCAISDQAGYGLLSARKAGLMREMAAWERDPAAPQTRVLDPQQPNPAVRRAIEQGLYRPITPILERSIQLGIYRPPAYVRSQPTQ